MLDSFTTQLHLRASLATRTCLGEIDTALTNTTTHNTPLLATEKGHLQLHCVVDWYDDLNCQESIEIMQTLKCVQISYAVDLVEHSCYRVHFYSKSWTD